jgi:hypothetical protein
MVDIHGAWSAGRYRFMQRYRSGVEHNRGDEFDETFARIDRMGRDHFDTGCGTPAKGAGSMPV